MAHPTDVALSHLKKVLARDPMLRDILADAIPGLTPTGPFQPDVDVLDTEGAHVLLIDVPGIAKDTVHVRLEGARLVVEGTRPAPSLAGASIRTRERAYGSFKREFLLPPDVVADDVTAAMDDGVLTVTVPRKGSASKRDVPIAGTD